MKGVSTLDLQERGEEHYSGKKEIEESKEIQSQSEDVSRKTKCKYDINSGTHPGDHLLTVSGSMT